jgi:hypothetical protein
LFDADQTAARQFLQRAAHRVAVDPEAGGEFGFRGQAAAWRIRAGTDILLEASRNLSPQGDTVLTVHWLEGRHRNFIHLAAHSCNS